MKRKEEKTNQNKRLHNLLGCITYWAVGRIEEVGNGHACSAESAATAFFFYFEDNNGLIRNSTTIIDIL
jgi:hypothetical protein